MKIQFTQRSLSDKRENEDRVQVCAFNDALIVVLADGAGGQMGGAQAAQIAVDVALEGARNATDLRNLEEWSEFLARADAAIDADDEAGITTIVALAAGTDWVAGASVGDSEAWLVGAGKILDLTAAQRRKPFLGQGARGKAFTAPWKGETLLVGSDGLFKYAAPETIAALARGVDLEAAADALIAQVRYASGALPDDVSLVLARH